MLFTIPSKWKYFCTGDKMRLFNIISIISNVGFKGFGSRKNNKSVITHKPAVMNMVKPFARQNNVKMQEINAANTRCNRALNRIWRFLTGGGVANKLKKSIGLLSVSLSLLCIFCCVIFVVSSPQLEKALGSLRYGPKMA